VGDIVHLLQPFRLTRYSEEFSFGLVVGFAHPDNPSNLTHQNPTLSVRAAQIPTTAQSVQVLLQLYDPERLMTYTDELGMEAFFCFDCDEVEPFEW
jgi:hypothetical protein